ncbi:hypothetical protein BSNK01_14930 [Bacillaceae bacterium]
MSGISVIIGIMFSVQLQSYVAQTEAESRDIIELRQDLQKEWEHHQRLLSEISKYDQLLYQYETTLNNEDTLSVMKKELARVKEQAGFVPIEGPGIIIRIEGFAHPVLEQPPSDSSPDRLEHLVVDSDLQTLVNDLFANEAKAIAINGERLIATSAIRNVGDEIQVNTRTIQPPFEIKVLGDPEVIVPALKLAGWEDYFKVINQRFLIVEAETLEIPAYRGSMNIRFMKPSKEKGE